MSRSPDPSSLRPEKSTLLRESAGDFEPLETLPEAPAHLTAAEAVRWQSVGAELIYHGTLCSQDLDALARYVHVACMADGSTDMKVLSLANVLGCVLGIGANPRLRVRKTTAPQRQQPDPFGELQRRFATDQKELRETLGLSQLNVPNVNND